MIESEFHTPNRCLAIINTRLATLRQKERELWDHIAQRWPEDQYGLKGQMMYARQAEELRYEIKVMEKWQRAWWDALEAIEGRSTYDETY